MNGEEEGSDTATAESGHSPPLTVSPPQGPDIDVGGVGIGGMTPGHHGDKNMMNSSAAAAFSQAVAAMQRCGFTKYFPATLFNDLTSDSIANNFVIDVFCRCLQILYRIAFFYKI